MALDAVTRPWSGTAFRHIPADASYGVSDFRFAGRGADNRWNYRAEPTLYLASDRGVVLAEFARHYQESRSVSLGRRTVERAVFRFELVVDALIDLREPTVQRALSLQDAPHRFLDKAAARSVAQFLRRTTAAQALMVPSAAFLDDLDRWVLVLFLDKLPADPARFITAVEPAGTFRVSP